MFGFIEGLPPNVLAIEARGKVTDNGPIRMLFVITDDATGFELEALRDDAAFGIKHYRDFSHIAVVSDHAWMRAMVRLFTPLIPANVCLCQTSDLTRTKTWIVATLRIAAMRVAALLGRWTPRARRQGMSCELLS